MLEIEKCKLQIANCGLGESLAGSPSRAQYRCTPQQDNWITQVARAPDWLAWVNRRLTAVELAAVRESVNRGKQETKGADSIGELRRLPYAASVARVASLA